MNGGFNLISTLIPQAHPPIISVNQRTARVEKTAQDHGIELKSRARRFEQEDLNDFDLIVAMDRENLENIKALDKSGSFAEKVILLREFDPAQENGEVPDPYYGGMNGFQNVFEIVKRSCENLLDELEEKI